MYIETKVAALIFGVRVNTLKSAVCRKSDRYDYIKIQTNARSYGGIKLLFKVSVGELKVALKSRTIDADINIWQLEENEWVVGKFGDLLEGDSNEYISDTRTNRTFEKQGLQGGSLCRQWQGKYQGSKAWQEKPTKQTNLVAKSHKGSVNDEKYNKTLLFAQEESLDKSSQSNTTGTINDKENKANLEEIRNPHISSGKRDNADDCVDKFQSNDMILQITGQNKKAGEINLFSINEKQKEKMKELTRIVLDWEEAKDKGVSCEKFCQMVGISRAKLFRAQKAYKEKGAKALVDKRGLHKKDATKLEGWMQELALEKYRAYAAGGLNLEQITEDLHFEASKRGMIDFSSFIAGTFTPLFTPGVVKRFLDKYFENNKLEQICATKGYDKAKSYFQPALGSHRKVVTHKNERWQIDSTKLDVFVRDDETMEAFRPEALQIVDMYSGRKVAVLTRQGNSFELVRLIWKAFETFGKPEFIKGDNGKDYLSERFQSLLDGLGIKYDRAIAYAGEKKGMVERSFGVIQGAGLSHVSGYVGNLAKRPAIEESLAEKKDRHAKDEYGYDKATNHKHLYTFSQFKKIYETEIMKWDLMSGRRRKGKASPLQIWNSDETPITRVAYTEYLLHAGVGYERSVNKEGIYLNGFIYTSQNLPSVRTKVIVKENIDDISTVFVYSMDGEFICMAKDKELAPLAIESLSLVNAAFNRSKRKVKKIIESARLSEFTKRDAQYDYEIMKKAHIDTLKTQNEIFESGSKIAKVAKESLKIEVLKSTNGDYNRYNFTTMKKESKKIKGYDEMLLAKKCI
ncbi:integrase [Campylobacter fetus subsp. testudinum]|uniref:Mu transposase C-terminal domain-containing protein n=1 Tax=Campylobacter fetus TaxID=196 RepID=UPI000CFD0ADB|nr:DDE-type integrase/transposase/recombinase [Campylobacter fetus]AVK80627.1 integrase [Campylobacter fetus subsp. testudinum]